MAAKRGGRAMADKHLELLRGMAPLAWRRSVEVRRLRKRPEEYERDRLQPETLCRDCLTLGAAPLTNSGHGRHLTAAVRRRLPG